MSATPQSEKQKNETITIRDALIRGRSDPTVQEQVNVPLPPTTRKQRRGNLPR